VVTRDVPDHGLVYGNPARLHGFVCACGQRLRRANGQDWIEETVKMTCPACERTVAVPRSDHARLVV
jgi:hypothetical protein